MTNRDNHPHYDRMSVEILRSFAERTGLIPPIDVYRILAELGYVPSSVLEIGAGTGRVVDALLDKVVGAKIFAAERTPNYITSLYDQYAAIDRVEILVGDVSSITLPRVDLTLWLWSGIAEFGPEEQPFILKRLAACSRRTVVLETPREGAATIVHRSEGQWHIYGWGDGTEYRWYVPTANELLAYAMSANLRVRDKIEYTTLTDRHRTLYFLDCQA